MPNQCSSSPHSLPSFPFSIFGEGWICLAILDQFLLTSFACFGKKDGSQICGTVLYMPLFGVFYWSIILTPLMANFQTSKFCGIGLGIWPLFVVKHIIFLEKFPS